MFSEDAKKWDKNALMKNEMVKNAKKTFQIFYFRSMLIAEIASSISRFPFFFRQKIDDVVRNISIFAITIALDRTHRKFTIFLFAFCKNIEMN